VTAVLLGAPRPIASTARRYLVVNVQAACNRK
jgi:hypothetical protein